MGQSLVGRFDWVFSINDKSGSFYFSFYVDTLDHSTFSFRSIDELRLERFVATGFTEYAYHRSSGFAFEQIKHSNLSGKENKNEQ